MSAFIHLKKLAGESLVYGVAGILSRFISVFLVPVYTRIFSPTDYGTVSLVVTFSALLNILVILGLDNSMARWFYDEENERERKITLNTFLWSCFGAAVLFGVLVFTLRGFIADRILTEPATAPLLGLAAVNLPLAVFSVFTTNVLRMQRRAVATTVFTIATSLLNILLNILFVIVLRHGIIGIFYAQLATSTVALVWTFVLFRKEISLPAFDFGRWREMLLFSLPLVPGSIAFWVVNLSGAYFVGLMNSTREVGLYYIGSNVASLLALITGAFQMAWGPFAYSIHRQADAKKTYAQVLLAFLAVTCLLALGLMLFAREILMIFTTQDYLGASLVAGLLAFNHILIGLGYIASIGTGIAKNNRAYGAAMLVSAGILVALNFVLVPRFGKEGAAVSILLSQLIVPIAVFWHAQRLYPIPYKFGKALLILLASFIFGSGGLYLLNLMNLNLAAQIGVKIFILLAFCALVFLALRNEMKTANLFLADAPTA